MNSDAALPRMIAVCVNRRHGQQPSCAPRGGESMASFLDAEVARRGLPIQIKRQICMGHCDSGPTVRLVPGPFLHAPDRQQLLDLLDGLPRVASADGAATRR